jgi:DNA-binding protein HU-beta
MTKDEMIEAVQKECEDLELSKKAASNIIDAVFDTMGAAIKNEARFSYPNFGTFKVTERAARKGRNPRTGAEIKIKASKTVKFAPAPKFKGDL